MTYHEYIFRIPQDAPDLDYASLNTWMGLRGQRKIGTTVTIVALDEHETAMGQIPASFEIWLYETLIARIYPDRVDFPGPDDPHMATSAWLFKVIRDNAIGHTCFRIRRHKNDGPGPVVARGQAGLLVIDGDRDKPVFGRHYPVDPAQIVAQRQADAERRERWAAEQKRYATEFAAREALKTAVHPDLGVLHAIADTGPDDTWSWRAVDGRYFGTLGYIRDTRTIIDDPSAIQASPYPSVSVKFGPIAVFEAYGKDEASLGAYPQVADALMAIGSRFIAEQEN